MAFLTLNGWTVPVELGGSYAPVVSGDRTPAFTGKPLMVRTGMKRRWQFTTTQMDDRAAYGLIGMVKGAGHLFPYTSNLYDGLGYTDTGTPVATITPGEDLQASAATVYDGVSAISEAKYGAGSLWMGPATSNLLSKDSSDAESGVSGFYVVNGSTIATEGTVVLQGSASIKCTTAASAFSGVGATNVTGLTATNTYTFSAYVYATEALSMDIYINGGSATVQTFTTVANSWVRVEVTQTFTGTTAICRIRHRTASAKVFYVDRLQLEEKSYGTPWVVGQGSRAAPSYDVGNICSVSDNLTVAGWFRAPTTERTAANNVMFVTDDGNTTSGDYLRVYRQASTNNIVVEFGRKDGGGAAGSITYATSPWDDDWHHIAVVLTAADNGATTIELYYDGASVGSSSDPAAYPRLRGTQTRCLVGYLGAGTFFDGRISELFVLPYAMSDAQIAALAARTEAAPAYPKLEALGDFNMSTDYQPEEVLGAPGQTQYAPTHNSAGAFSAARRKVSFVLDSTKDV